MAAKALNCRIDLLHVQSGMKWESKAAPVQFLGDCQRQLRLEMSAEVARHRSRPHFDAFVGEMLNDRGPVGGVG
jgi:hypothetical protein